MCWIVLPLIAAAAIAADVRAVAALNVGVTVEVVVHVDIDIAASPTGTPAPATTAPGGADSHTDAKRDRACRDHSTGGIRRIVNRRVGIIRVAINNLWVVGRHIHYLWTGLFDDNDALAFHHPGLYGLLLVGLQGSLSLCFRAHSLYGIHHIGLLCEESVAKICGPLNVI